jgi:hypothetical protein
MTCFMLCLFSLSFLRLNEFPPDPADPPPPSIYGSHVLKWGCDLFPRHCCAVPRPGVSACEYSIPHLIWILSVLYDTEVEPGQWYPGHIKQHRITIRPIPKFWVTVCYFDGKPRDRLPKFMTKYSINWFSKNNENDRWRESETTEAE